MSKRIKLPGIFVIVIISTFVLYFMLSYTLRDVWLKAYLCEAYGGKQWVMAGEGCKYYAYKPDTDAKHMTYEGGIFKTDKTYKFCLQPERNYYKGKDIFITTIKLFISIKRIESSIQ